MSESVQMLEAVRELCIEAGIRGYENARISGLCAEGAFEAAISAIRMADLSDLLKQHAS